MAFLMLMLKGMRIERHKDVLEEEKKNAVNAKYGLEARMGIRQKYRHLRMDAGRGVRKFFRKITSFPEQTRMHKMCYNLRHDGSCENFTLKSVVGFIGGFFLTYVFFWFFVFQLNFKLSTATIMCAIFGCILTIGLAFSYKVRSVVFLLLPQFFSKRGRQALLAYAFILAITGPAKNTLNNMSILSESLACGQEQLKSAVKQILEVIKKPFYAIKDAIKAVIKKVKEIVKKIKEILMSIKRIIISIIKVIKAAFMFLAKIINICNKELGTPFQRCGRVFENAIADCNAKLGPLFSWMCSITYLVKTVCYIVKVFDFVCMIVDFISNSIVGVVIKKVKSFVRHIKTIFYVRIKFSHSFSFETNRSKTVNEIAEGIVTEVKHRAEAVMAIFDIMTCATSLFFMFLIFKVMHYRFKFLTNDRFDNRFITKDFRKIDMKRAQLEKETVLPLNHREKQLYVKANSLRLVKVETRQLSKSAMVLGTASIKLCTHMMTDYALYWVLKMIRYHARFQSTVQAPKVAGLHIVGTGMLASLLRAIVKAFQPLGIELEIDTVPCLPDPIPPDYDRYIQIASLLGLCWLLTIAEPYGLRLRHSIMCYYHPVRARQRAIWLYNHVIRNRSSFLKFARRQLRRKVMGDKKITKITCKEHLRAKCSNPVCLWLLGSDNQEACLLCGEVFREDDKKPIRCQNPGCLGIYCEQCFNDLQNLCTVCLSPVQYGDLSDISEEKDSSEEEAPVKKKKKKKKKLTWKLENKDKKGDDDDDDDDDSDKKRLLPTGEDGNLSPASKSSDSDYDSEFSSSSTQYSYSYQDDKNITALQASTDISLPFRDVEKQHIPDYASMETFRDEYESTDYNTNKTASTGKISTFWDSSSKYSDFASNNSSPSTANVGTTTKIIEFYNPATQLFSEASVVARVKRKKARESMSLTSSSSSLLSDLEHQHDEWERERVISNVPSYLSRSNTRAEIPEQGLEMKDYTKYLRKREKHTSNVGVNTEKQGGISQVKFFGSLKPFKNLRARIKKESQDYPKESQTKQKFRATQKSVSSDNQANSDTEDNTITSESSETPSTLREKLLSLDSSSIKTKASHRDKKPLVPILSTVKEVENLESDTTISDIHSEYGVGDFESRSSAVLLETKRDDLPLSIQFSEASHITSAEPKVNVPKLNLDFLEKDSKYPGKKFDYIKFKTIDESPKSSSSKSFSSSASPLTSTDITSSTSGRSYSSEPPEVRNALNVIEGDVLNTVRVRKRRDEMKNRLRAGSSSDFDLICSTDESHSDYRKRVRHYYKTVGNQTPAVDSTKKSKRRSKFGKFLSRLFKKKN